MLNYKNVPLKICFDVELSTASLSSSIGEKCISTPTFLCTNDSPHKKCTPAFATQLLPTKLCRNA